MGEDGAAVAAPAVELRDTHGAGARLRVRGRQPCTLQSQTAHPRTSPRAARVEVRRTRKPARQAGRGIVCWTHRTAPGNAGPGADGGTPTTAGTSSLEEGRGVYAAFEALQLPQAERKGGSVVQTFDVSFIYSDIHLEPQVFRQLLEQTIVDGAGVVGEGQLRSLAVVGDADVERVPALRVADQLVDLAGRRNLSRSRLPLRRKVM